MKTRLLTIVLATLASTAGAADWQFLVTSASDNGVVEIDVSSVARVDTQTRKAWFRQSLGKPKRLAGETETYSETKSLVHFRCAERTSGSAQMIYYSEAGAVVRFTSIPKDSISFDDVIPDSIGEAMLNAVCNPTRKAAPQSEVPTS